MQPPEPMEKKKKEKKKKFVRTAAGVVWEDNSLSDWDQGEWGCVIQTCSGVIYGPRHMP